MNAESRVTRRSFLGGVGGAGLIVSGGLAATEAAAQGLSPGGPAVPVPDVSGRIARLDLDAGTVDLVDVDPGGRPQARLLVSAATIFERVGPSVLTAFAAGERIVAFGDWQDATTLAAKRIAVTFSVLRERIVRRQGVGFQTASGVTVDPSAVQRADPFSDPDSYRPLPVSALAELVAPELIEVLGIFNEDSKILTAVSVGLVPN